MNIISAYLIIVCIFFFIKCIYIFRLGFETLKLYYYYYCFWTQKFKKQYVLNIKHVNISIYDHKLF